MYLWLLDVNSVLLTSHSRCLGANLKLVIERHVSNNWQIALETITVPPATYVIHHLALHG